MTIYQETVQRDWPSEAQTICDLIANATGVYQGSALGRLSMATPMNGTDLKTMLRRLYSALGGVRGQYDPNADELRGLYAGTVSASTLMAKGAGNAGTEAKAPTTATPPVAQEAETEATAAPFRHPVTVEPAAPVVKQPKGQPDATALANMLASLMAAPQIDEEAVRAIVDQQAGTVVAKALENLRPELQAMADAATRRVEIVIPEAPTVKIDTAHNMLPTILKACVAGVHPFLVGPAGSGKTTLARQIAEALSRPFYMQARVTSEYKLTGFIDANGKAVQTDFRRAYEDGGVFLFDEIDASDADALTAFNAPLANGYADFPDGQVKQHPDFVAIAAGNTFGRGANREYVGRQQLDAATLDRFAIFEIDYDEKLEKALSGDADWTGYVQRVRAAVEREKVRHIVSPRASITGAKLLAAGLERKAVEEAVVWKGMAEAERNRVEAAMSYSR
jgi:cobaltochelatase CobS